MNALQQPAQKPSARILPFLWPAGFIHRESLRGPARVIQFPTIPRMHTRLERPRGWAALRKLWEQRFAAGRKTRRKGEQARRQHEKARKGPALLG